MLLSAQDNQNKMAEDMVSAADEIILLKELNHRVTALEAKFLGSQVEQRAPPAPPSPPDVDKKDALADYYNNNNNVVNLPALLILAMTGVLVGTGLVGAAVAVMLFAKRV